MGAAAGQVASEGVRFAVRAIRQHFDRLSRVDGVRSELEALIGKISEAGK